jgi:hypothetical protein
MFAQWSRQFHAPVSAAPRSTSMQQGVDSTEVDHVSLQSGRACAPIAAHRLLHHARAGRSRAVRCAVARAIVDNDHLVNALRQYLAHDGADRLFFVQARNDHADFALASADELTGGRRSGAAEMRSPTASERIILKHRFSTFSRPADKRNGLSGDMAPIAQSRVLQFGNLMRHITAKSATLRKIPDAHDRGQINRTSS